MSVDLEARIAALESEVKRLTKLSSGEDGITHALACGAVALSATAFLGRVLAAGDSEAAKALSEFHVQAGKELDPEGEKILRPLIERLRRDWKYPPAG